MINVSRECRQRMQTNTGFLEYVTITLADETELEIPQSDLIIQGNGITSGAGANAFPLGQASARTIRVEIANFGDEYSEYDFYGATIGLIVKYPLSVGYESFYYGYYTVITPATRGTTIKLTAVDDMYKADKPYTTSLSFPSTALQVYLDACQTTGITIQTARFTNDDFVISKKPENCSFRQVIGGCAMLAGGNAYINREGRLVIKEYDLSALEDWLEVDGGVYKPWETADIYDGGSFNPWNTGDAADGGSYQDSVNGVHVLYAWLSPPNIDTDDIVITGVKTSISSEESILEGAEGYVLNVENPLIVGSEEDALDAIGDIVIGLKFRQFSGEYIGDPTIEFMDPCIVVDRKGNVYGSFVTDTDYNFRGRTSIKNSAEPKIRTGITYSNNNVKTIQKVHEIVDSEISAYDLGVQILGKLITQSMGFYETKEVDSNGSVIQYMHDQPTLEQSTTIWKKTATAFAVSTDGGATWNAGMDAAGNAVLNTLAVRGLSADWITTGLLTGNRINAKNLSVNDTNGNVTLAVDQNGQVYIRATSFSLAGKTVEQIVEDMSANLLVDSLGLPTDYWTIHGTLTRNQSDPDGGTNAVMLTPASDEGYIQAKPSNNMPFKVLGATYRFSVWLKADNIPIVSPQTPITLYFNGESVGDIYPTDSWQEYVFEKKIDAISQTAANDLITIGGFASYTSSDDYDLYVYNPSVTYTDTQTFLLEKITKGQNGIWLTNNGQLYIVADAINVNDLSALQATIGGFTIDSTSIRNQSVTSHNSGAVALSISEFTREINGDDIAHLRFAIGSKFGVTSTGNVYAANGEFEGKVEASSGKIANLYIGSTYFRQVGTDVYGNTYYPLSITSGTIKTQSNYLFDITLSGHTIQGQMAGSGSNSLRIYGYNTAGWQHGGGSNNYNVIGGTEFTGQVYCTDGLAVASGTKSAIAQTDNYGEQAFYCYETPTPMFGDIGSAQLDETGMCIVAFDDIFAESVSTDIQYQVFLQKCGNGDLWVESKDPAFFVVSGTPGLAFDWEVKAKQKPHNQIRYSDDGRIPKDYDISDLENIYTGLLDYENGIMEETENAFLNEALSENEIEMLYEFEGVEL